MVHAWAVLKSTGWKRPAGPQATGDFRINLVLETSAAGMNWLVTLAGRYEPESLSRVLYSSPDALSALQAFDREAELFFGPDACAPAPRPERQNGGAAA